jgi:hypothetical protein
MLPPEQRGTAMATLMLAPLLGGAVGPAIAGAIAQSIGWRRILWVGAGIAGVCELAFLLALRETYKITILKRRLKKERRDSYVSIIDPEKESATKTIWRSIKRPATVFGDSIVLQILSLYGSLIFTFFYIMATTLPSILESEYGFSPASTGSAFLSFSKLPSFLFDTEELIVQRYRLLFWNCGLQPHARPYLCQTPNSKQRDRPTRTPHALNRHKRIHGPTSSHTLRLDGSEPLARSNTPPIRWPPRVLSAPLHGAFDGIRHRCFRYLLCVGFDRRLGLKVFDEHFFTFERCASY